MNKTGESHQHIWNVFVDLDKHTVTGISEEPERIMRETLEPNLIYTGMKGIIIVSSQSHYRRLLEQTNGLQYLKWLFQNSLLRVAEIVLL